MITLEKHSIGIRVLEGKLRLEKLVLTHQNQARTLDWTIIIEPGIPATSNI